jgi:hypothetical protein
MKTKLTSIAVIALIMAFASIASALPLDFDNRTTVRPSPQSSPAPRSRVVIVSVGRRPLPKWYTIRITYDRVSVIENATGRFREYDLQEPHHILTRDELRHLALDFVATEVAGVPAGTRQHLTDPDASVVTFDEAGSIRPIWQIAVSDCVLNATGDGIVRADFIRRDQTNPATLTTERGIGFVIQRDMLSHTCDANGKAILNWGRYYEASIFVINLSGEDIRNGRRLMPPPKKEDFIDLPALKEGTSPEDLRKGMFTPPPKKEEATGKPYAS